MGLGISIAAEPIFEIGNLVITNSLFTTFIVIGLFFLIVILFKTHKLETFPQGKSLQNFLEIIIEGFLNFFSSIVGITKARLFFPFLTTLFLFVLISNWFGLLPGVGSIGIWETHNGENILVPLFRAPTADLNTTIALALIGVIYIQIQGIKHLNLNYFKKFFNFSSPIFFFVGFLELISEFTKIISFAFRLFGNIFAGEVLLSVMFFLLPALAPLPFLGLEIFVGVIQALVFAMLLTVFTAGATHKHG